MAKKKTTPNPALTGKKRTRAVRPYPACSFKEARSVGDAIVKFASGEKVRRLTLLGHMNRKPTSGATNQLITNSGKYKITKGSYSAEWLELTPLGKVACDPKSPAAKRLQALFDLSIGNIPPFRILYDAYVGKPLPVHDVLVDVLKDSTIKLSDHRECVDLFVVNAKDAVLLKTIAGTETLVSIEQVLDERGAGADLDSTRATEESEETVNGSAVASATDWDNVCFYITPIGAPDSEARKHADMFMKSLIEPAMEELKLRVVRADKIGKPGMITSNIIEHIKKSRLAIADLSTLNPNVLYEVALRHTCRLPVVQIIRKSDHLPFDINQVNTIVIDTSDIYTLVPQIETHRSEIATLAREAIRDPDHVSNPITVFYPQFWD